MHKESIKGREFLPFLLYYFFHHTAGLLNVAMEKSQNYSDWACTESCFLILWLLTILLLTPVFSMTSGLTEIVRKCGLLGNSLPGPLVSMLPRNE